MDFGHRCLHVTAIGTNCRQCSALRKPHKAGKRPSGCSTKPQSGSAPDGDAEDARRVLAQFDPAWTAPTRRTQAERNRREAQIPDSRRPVPAPAVLCQQSVSTPASRRPTKQRVTFTRQCRRAVMMWCRAWCRRAVCRARTRFTRQRPQVRNLPRPPARASSSPLRDSCCRRLLVGHGYSESLGRRNGLAEEA